MKILISLTTLIIMSTHAFSQGKDVKYSQDGIPLKGYYSKPKGTNHGKVPGVLILHAWMGITDHEKNAADKLSQMGYHAFVADVYGENNRPNSIAEAKKFTALYKGNIILYQKRIRAAIDELLKKGADPDRLAVIGYCFGGTGAIEAARVNMPVAGIVSFHGGLDRDTNRTISQIKPKLLILHGAEDPTISDQQIKNFQNEMRRADADWQMIYYAHAMHSFTEPEVDKLHAPGNKYNALAARRSWEHMKIFLTDLFLRK